MTLQLPQSAIRLPALNPSPTIVSEILIIRTRFKSSISIYSNLNFFFLFQFYRPLQHSLATPHSIHSFPQAPSTMVRYNYGTSLDDNIVGYHFRDRERELYERQIEFEHELDRER